jgi:hypothetical protein
MKSRVKLWYAYMHYNRRQGNQKEARRCTVLSKTVNQTNKAKKANKQIKQKKNMLNYVIA